MEAIHLGLEGEEAAFFWKDGKVCCKGYDYEGEKAVLALTGFGEGIGVLLIAINDTCKSEADFISEINAFVVGHKKILLNHYYVWPKGQLLFEYFSYSSDSYLPWGGMESARLSERHYQRILKDPEMKFKIEMARLSQLPAKYFPPLLKLSLDDVSSLLATHKNCPGDILEILAQNEDENVRGNVAGNLACPKRILAGLSNDNNSWVRQSVAANPNCPEIILRLLASDNNLGVRICAAWNQAST